MAKRKSGLPTGNPTGKSVPKTARKKVGTVGAPSGKLNPAKKHK
jgi:hypothetical protein